MYPLCRQIDRETAPEPHRGFGAAPIQSYRAYPSRLLANRSCSHSFGHGQRCLPVGADLPQQRSESLEGPKTSWPPSEAQCFPETKTTEASFQRGLTLRLSQRPLDNSTHCRSDQRSFQSHLRSRSHWPSASSMWVELSAPHPKSPGTRRDSDPKLAQEHLATHQKKARALGATLVFLDESGFSLKPTVTGTWAPKGKTPVVYSRANWGINLSAISAVTHRAKLYLQLYTHAIRHPQVLRFLKHLHRCIRKPIIVLLDRAKIHRAKTLLAWVRENRSKVILEFLPTYAPEMNPEEWFWGHMKYRKLALFCPRNTHELKEQVLKSYRSIRRRPRLLQSFLKASALDWSNIKMVS